MLYFANFQWIQRPWPQNQALNKLWHTLDRTYGLNAPYWCHRHLDNIIGHLWVSKSAGLAVKIAFPMQIPCKSTCFAVVKGAMVVKTLPRKVSGKNYPLKKLVLTYQIKPMPLTSSHPHICSIYISPNFQWNWHPWPQNQAMKYLWHILDHNCGLHASYWCHLHLDNIIGHLWASKSAGLAVKSHFPCKSHANPHGLRWSRVQWWWKHFPERFQVRIILLRD